MKTTRKPRNPSAILSPEDTLQQAMLTSEASPTCAPMICATIPNAISLLASADGPSRAASLDGPTSDKCGAEAAPASRAVLPDDNLASPILVTSGRFGENLSPSDALQQSLENRLRR